jgi:uncharacterized protein (DUF2141 family)
MKAAVTLLAIACSSAPGGGGGGGDPGPGVGGTAAAAPPARTGALTVVMTGFRADKGEALVGIYRGAAGFPDDGARAVERIAVPIAGRRAVARFPAAPAGRIAVAVLHDEDGDKKMKTGLFGRPKEGYGASRDAPARFGPPKFGDAAFDLAAGQALSIDIKIRY